MAPQLMPAEALGNATIRRVEWLTVGIGGVGVAWAGWHWGWRGALGLALGAGISWINFRWLKGSVRAFGQVSVASPEKADQPADAPPQPVAIPLSAYLKFFGRFGLLLLVVYVILTRTWFPAVSVLAGLFASAAAVLAGLVWELVLSGVRANTGGQP